MGTIFIVGKRRKQKDKGATCLCVRLWTGIQWSHRALSWGSPCTPAQIVVLVTQKCKKKEGKRKTRIGKCMKETLCTSLVLMVTARPKSTRKMVPLFFPAPHNRLAAWQLKLMIKQVGGSLGSQFRNPDYCHRTGLYHSPILGVDSANTSQLPKEKNLHGQFLYFQITHPARQ